MLEAARRPGRRQGRRSGRAQDRGDRADPAGPSGGAGLSAGASCPGATLPYPAPQMDATYDALREAGAVCPGSAAMAAGQQARTAAHSGSAPRTRPTGGNRGEIGGSGVGPQAMSRCLAGMAVPRQPNPVHRGSTCHSAQLPGGNPATPPALHRLPGRSTCLGQGEAKLQLAPQCLGDPIQCGDRGVAALEVLPALVGQKGNAQPVGRLLHGQTSTLAFATDHPGEFQPRPRVDPPPTLRQLGPERVK